LNEAVEHFAGAGQLVKITGHRVLNQFAGAASGLRYPMVELRLKIGVGEVYIHMTT
jgi:hypothetical protein